MDWYSTFQDKNYQVNWLYHHFLDKSDSIPIENVFDVVKGELLKFKLIGYVDNFEKDSTHLMRLIGLPAIQYRANVSGRDFPIIKKITPKLRQAILEDCEYDLKLINDLIKK